MGPGIQYRGFIRDEYKLAGIRRRINDELSDSDGGAHCAEFCFGGNRNGCRPSAHQGFYPEGQRFGRQYLGGFDTLGAIVVLPLSIIVAVMLISQGVIQNLDPYVTAHTIEGAKQVIPMGPAATR